MLKFESRASPRPTLRFVQRRLEQPAISSWSMFSGVASVSPVKIRDSIFLPRTWSAKAVTASSAIAHGILQHDAVHLAGT